MTRERACAACEGTGFQLDSYVDPGEFQRAADYWSALECPACRGTGRQTDRVPASDMVADWRTAARLCAAANEGV